MISLPDRLMGPLPIGFPTSAPEPRSRHGARQLGDLCQSSWLPAATHELKMGAGERMKMICRKECGCEVQQLQVKLKAV